MLAKGSAQADTPTSPDVPDVPDVPDGLRVTPPALLALTRLLGRLAAIQAQESTPNQEPE